MPIKFVDKEIQEDWDSIPEDTKRKHREDWLMRHPQKHKIMFVKEWLEYKRNQQFANFNWLPASLKVAAQSLSLELFPSSPPSHGLQFEIIDGKLTTRTVKISKD